MGFNTSMKQPVSDKACERAVLGLVLTYNSCLDELTTDLFHDGECKAILAVALALRDAGKEADIVNVMDYSQRHQCGINPVTLTELMSEAAPTGAFKQDVALLRELAKRRRLQTLNFLLDSAATNKALDVDEAIDKAISELDTLRASTIKADYFINVGMEIEEPPFLVRQFDVGCNPVGDISAVKAKSKNGKSHFCAILCASVLGCNDFGFTSNFPDASVLLCDTEQAAYNSVKIVRKIHALLGWPTHEPNDRLEALNLRSYAPKERMRIITKEAKRLRPTLVVIDGVADVCENFNDVTESNATINALMKLSTECKAHILCVLHENKAKDDNGMKGHLGTLLLQKASDVWQVAKSGSTFTATHTDTRNQQCEPVTFALDGYGVPMRAASVAEVRKEENKEVLAKLIREAFGQSRDLSYSELCDRIAAYGGVSLPTAKRRLKSAREFGIISVIPESNKYTL